MRYYPINLDIAGRRVVIAGGGLVAERKAAMLLAAGANLIIVSPRLTASLRDLAAAGVIEWRQQEWQAEDAAGSFLVVCATDKSEVNVTAATDARKAGALVNVVDNPALGNFTVPAIISRGELLLTVSTGGASPMLARRIKEQIEQLYGEEFGNYLQELAIIREQMKDCLADSAERELFWRSALDALTLDLVRQGKLREAKEKIYVETSGARHKSQDCSN